MNLAVPKSEEWKPVIGYEGLYEVSNYGRVRSLDRVARNGRGSRVYTGKLLKPQPLRSGYLTVNLSSDGSVTRHLVHRIVCISFHGKPTGRTLEVGHFNGDQKDNRAENLRWCSHLENMSDRDRHGRTLRGESHPQSKLSEGDVLDLRRRAHSGETVSQMAREYGVSRAAMHSAVTGQTWAHLPNEKAVSSDCQ